MLPYLCIGHIQSTAEQFDALTKPKPSDREHVINGLI